MGGRGIAVRILGLASTTRGFAFAVTEGPNRLVHGGVRRTPTDAPSDVAQVLLDARPLFVAFDEVGSCKKRHRGKMFSKVVNSACHYHRIMILPVDREQIARLSEKSHPTKWDVAEALARRFPEVAHKLPGRRKAWQSEDDRIGLFMALASAVATWDSFRKPRG